MSAPEEATPRRHGKQTRCGVAGIVVGAGAEGLYGHLLPAGEGERGQGRGQEWGPGVYEGGQVEVEQGEEERGPDMLCVLKVETPVLWDDAQSPSSWLRAAGPSSRG